MSKILFLRVPDADADFGKHIASGISADGVAHEFVDVGPDTYDSILDRLEVGVLPVVLKPAGP